MDMGQSYKIFSARHPPDILDPLLMERDLCMISDGSAFQIDHMSRNTVLCSPILSNHHPGLKIQLNITFDTCNTDVILRQVSVWYAQSYMYSCT